MSTLIGRWGRMVAFDGPAPSVVAGTSRPVPLVTSLSGRVYSKPQPVARRAWSWPLESPSDESLSALEQLEQDAARGVLYWMDPTAVGSNMLPPEVATPRAVGDLTDEGTFTADGRLWDGVGGEVVHDVPTVDGTDYEVTVRGDGSNTTSITVEALDIDRVVGSTLDSSTGTGVRSVQWTAGSEAGVRITIDGTQWSGAQMYELDLDPGSWRPGRGVPMVRLTGLTSSLLWALASGDVNWESASVTLVEVDE